MRSIHYKYRDAFSLVELSIVLVILGLLVGGVLAGQSLIRSAELRSIGTQFQRYQSATQSFRDKYFALPGDFVNAQTFWGVADPTPATCTTTAGIGTQTCNGNGDGIINSGAGFSEPFRFWQHLANAGLIEGTYDGINHGSGTFSATSANTPTGKLSSSLWFAYSWGVRSGSAVFFDGDYGNGFSFGGVRANSDPTTPILKPEEMWNIDTKLDDGMPATGNIRPRDWSTLQANCTNATVSNQTNATYLLTNTSPQCMVVFARAY